MPANQSCEKKAFSLSLLQVSTHSGMYFPPLVHEKKVESSSSSAAIDFVHNKSSFYYHIRIVVSRHSVEWLCTLHTDTWVYKKSKYEFCTLASKHALWCKNRSSLNKLSLRDERLHKLSFFNTSLYGDFTIENQVFH